MLQCHFLQGEEEFHLIAQTQNPPIHARTCHIWILSSRHDIKKQHINCAKESKNFTPFSDSIAPQSQQVCDVEDDYERIKVALELATKLVAQRAKKEVQQLVLEDYDTHAPWIIYNGWPEQNSALDEAKNDLTSLKLPAYPASKIITFDMPGDALHTGGQFNAMAEMTASDPRLQCLRRPHSHITIVTSAYHIPRVRRLLSSSTFKNPFTPETTISFHGIDRQFKRPCANRDVLGELKRIADYTKSGHIGKPGKSQWYDTASFTSWLPLRNATFAAMPKPLIQEQDHTDITLEAATKLRF